MLDDWPLRLKSFHIIPLQEKKSKLLAMAPKTLHAWFPQTSQPDFVQCSSLFQLHQPNHGLSHVLFYVCSSLPKSVFSWIFTVAICIVSLAPKIKSHLFPTDLKILQNHSIIFLGVLTTSWNYTSVCFICLFNMFFICQPSFELKQGLLSLLLWLYPQNVECAWFGPRTKYIFAE